MEKFVLRPKEIKVLRLDEISEKHRQAVKEKIEHNAAILLEKYADADLEVARLKYFSSLSKGRRMPSDFMMKLDAAEKHASLHKEFIENRSVLIKHALKEFLNNFHNRFPGFYEEPERTDKYGKILPVLEAEAREIGLDLRKWIEEDLSITAALRSKHRFKLWPLYLRMLKHVDDIYDLTR